MALLILCVDFFELDQCETDLCLWVCQVECERARSRPYFAKRHSTTLYDLVGFMVV